MSIICCGFGHSNLYCNITKELNEKVVELIEQHGVTVFLTGGMGDFDSAFSSAVRSAKHNHKGVKLILVKPYFSNELNINKDYYELFYDDVTITEQLAGVHYKSAIQKRNRWMVDQSEFVLSAIYRDFGGAYQTIHYAKRIGKTVIDIVKNKSS